MVGLTLCRGCCCGTLRKRPAVDHAGQLAALRALADSGAATLQTSDCLGPCDRANVLVVRPDRRARVAGARPVWLGNLGDAELPVLLTWISAGGPGRSPLPPALQDAVIPPEDR